MVKKLALEVFKTTLGCLFYCAVIMAIVYACLGCYHFGFQIFSNPVYDQKSTNMKQIDVGASDKEMDIMKRLQEEAVVQDYRVAFIRLQFSEYKDKIQPGSYQVNASMPLDDILATLSHMVEEDTEEGIATNISKDANVPRTDSNESDESDKSDKSDDTNESDESSGESEID